MQSYSGEHLVAKRLYAILKYVYKNRNLEIGDFKRFSRLPLQRYPSREKTENTNKRTSNN